MKKSRHSRPSHPNQPQPKSQPRRNDATSDWRPGAKPSPPKPQPHRGSPQATRPPGSGATAHANRPPNPRPPAPANTPHKSSASLHWREALVPFLAEPNYQPLDEKALARRL